MKELVITCMYMGGKWAEYVFPDLISVLSGPGERLVLMDELDAILKGGTSEHTWKELDPSNLDSAS